ncbi:MAG: glycosyltransferase family 4 protein, partial [Acetobacteraceae bacterium]|nr:glycosyltransferase family 4 protein [Acetobacteraceae bacterium]
LCFEVASAFVERGHDVHVLASGHGGGTAEYPGQTIRRALRLLAGEQIYAPFPGDAAARDAVNRANLDALRDAIARARPDAVFAWNLFFLDRSFLSALGGCGLPVSVMLTDNWLLSMERPEYLARFFQEHVFGRAPFPPAASPPPPPSAAGLWGRLRSLVRPAAPPVPVAPPPAEAERPPPLRFPFGAVFGAAFVRDLYADAGVSFERSRVVHNGVRQEPRPGAAFRDRARLVRDGELRLLFAGRLVDLKGAHDAVAAMPLIRPEEAGAEEVRLTLLGDARDAVYAERLRREVAASGRADRIEILPPVAEDALFDLFQEHDIYLFPSLYEPFSLTLIHALACGIPTAASRAGGNPEIVRDGESGVLFEKGEPADLARAVLRLARDPALRAGVSAGGRAAAARFTFESMVDGMEAFLLEGTA